MQKSWEDTPALNTYCISAAIYFIPRKGSATTDNTLNEQSHARDCLHLQEYILWGPDQRTKKIWNQESTCLLADRFEMLIGAIYLEKGLDAVLAFLQTHRFFKMIDAL